MASTTQTLGGFLEAPSVHDLAQQKLTSVPPRYMRLDQDPPSALPNSSSFLELPVIDMQNLLCGGELMNLELKKLDFVCKEWGFFQLINHGVNSPLMEKVKNEAERFFHLPKEEKEKCGKAAEGLQGFGHTFILSEEQKLDWVDMFYIVTLPTELRKPQLFSKLPMEFRQALEVYSMDVQSLGMEILRQMATALEMKVEDMTMPFKGGRQSMRMNHYPPCPQPELVIGLNSHSDSVGLTILLQVGEVEGLQVKKDGAWIPVVPLRNAFIVNVGDMLEIMTNGIYKSAEHRATVNSDVERISVATFLSPGLDSELGPAPSLITLGNPEKFKRIIVADYLKGYLSREHGGKSYLDSMRI